MRSFTGKGPSPPSTPRWPPTGAFNRPIANRTVKMAWSFKHHPVCYSRKKRGGRGCFETGPLPRHELLHFLWAAPSDRGQPLPWTWGTERREGAASDTPISCHSSEMRSIVYPAWVFDLRSSGASLLLRAVERGLAKILLAFKASPLSFGVTAGLCLTIQASSEQVFRGLGGPFWEFLSAQLMGVGGVPASCIRLGPWGDRAGRRWTEGEPPGAASGMKAELLDCRPPTASIAACFGEGPAHG